MEPTQSLKPDKPADAGGGLGVDDPGSAGRAALAVDGDLVIDELLVEEISIDGMCGVY